jgi:hypothetical protein
MFLVFAIACSAQFLNSEAIWLGLLSSAWCGLVYAAVLVVFAFVLGFIFMPHMEHILAVVYASSGMTEPSAFVTRHLLTNASSHIFIAPLIALVIGAVSAVACLLLKSVRPRTAIVLSVVGLTLFVAGVASIRVATSLACAQRPPFIQFGLAALAITLASAHPLFAAARSGRSPP